MRSRRAVAAHLLAGSAVWPVEPGQFAPAVGRKLKRKKSNWARTSPTDVSDARPSWSALRRFLILVGIRPDAGGAPEGEAPAIHGQFVDKGAEPSWSALRR